MRKISQSEIAILKAGTVILEKVNDNPEDFVFVRTLANSFNDSVGVVGRSYYAGYLEPTTLEEVLAWEPSGERYASIQNNNLYLLMFSNGTAKGFTRIFRGWALQGENVGWDDLTVDYIFKIV